MIATITRNQLSHMNDFDLEDEDQNAYDNENEIYVYSFVEELKDDHIDLDNSNPKVFEGNIIDKKSIKSLMTDGQVVICAGGGGIPVIKENNRLEGIAAVIDKDYASSKLADLIDADYLVILTAVDNASINFNKENERKLENVSVKEMEQYLNEGHFAKGSMYPKVQACLSFVKSGANKTAIIASLANAKSAFKEKAGTIIK